MATAHLPPEPAHVIQSNRFPPSAAARLAANLLNRHSPHEIAEAIEVMVDVLDLMGGDPDVEANGDELDGDNAEDEIGNRHLAHTDRGAGCPISDPDAAVDDAACDEPDQDLEAETGAHWMDHPPEVHLGHRPGWNDPKGAS